MSKIDLNKRFLAALGFIWLLVPAIDLVAFATLEREFFAFRAWEIVRQETDQRPFAPSIRFEMDIFGDLANKLKVKKFRQYRHQVFTTDPYGFRNKEASANRYCPIVVTGDSDMAGSSLSDDETFSSQLSSLLNAPVYNYAPFTPIDFLEDKRFMKRPPKILIWGNVERFIDGEIYRRYTWNKGNRGNNREKEQGNETFFRKPRLSAHMAQQVFQELRWHMTGLMHESIYHIDQESMMLFYTPGVKQLGRDRVDRDFATIVAGIGRIRQRLLEKDIILLFLPIPDKENIYRHMLPGETPGKDRLHPFLVDLRVALSESGIHNIDIYNIYEKLSQNEPYLYFRDDTHWSPAGVKAAAEATAAYIRAHHLR